MTAPTLAASAFTTEFLTMNAQLHLIDHPLMQHKLSLMRVKDTRTKNFRQLAREISALLAYELTRDMPTQTVRIETPLEAMDARDDRRQEDRAGLDMRAGSGLLEGMLAVVPSARVGHIGLYRDPKTLVAVEYYFKMPSDMHERDAIVLDPMLATGNSAAAAVERLKETRPRSIRFVSLLAVSGGHGALPRRAPGRAGLHRGDRPRAQRPRLHRSRPGRRRRPPVRHQVARPGRGANRRAAMFHVKQLPRSHRLRRKQQQPRLGSPRSA